MATYTTTASGNESSGATWVGGVAPSTGDDIIVAGHTLTFDRDVTWNSITLNNASSRLAIGASATRVVTIATTITRTVAPSATTMTLTTGQTFTIWGTFSNIANVAQYVFTLTGGTLNIEGAGGGDGSLLYQTLGGLNINERFVTSLSGTSTCTAKGRFECAVSIAGTVLAFTFSASGTYAWTWTGTSFISSGSTGTRLWTATGTTCNCTISGQCTSNIAVSANGLFHFSSPSGVSNLTLDISSNASTTLSAALLYVQSGEVILTGKISHATGTNSLSINVVGGTFRYKNQTVNLSAGEAQTLTATAGTFDVNNLIFNVADDALFTWLLIGSVTYTGTGMAVNVDPDGIAGANYIPFNFVYLESDPPTLPPIANVASGEVYGYALSPLVGTGLIVDSSVFQAALLPITKNTNLIPAIL